MTALIQEKIVSQNNLPPINSREKAREFVKTLQDNICQGLESIDGKAKFQEDNWQREDTLKEDRRHIKILNRITSIEIKIIDDHKSR